MNKIYNVVLIGCGHIGAAHLDDIFYRDEIKIVGVVDTNLERAKEFAKKYLAPSYGTDYKKYLECKDVDIVIIATYVSSHLTILKDCLKAKKNVLCEKPIAADMKSGLEFYRTVKLSDSKVLVGHILRHNKTYQHVAEMIHSGAIGKVKLIRMVQNHHAIDWERYKKLLSDCSPIIDCGVHYVDVIQWFTDSKVIRVSGIKATLDKDIPNGTYNYGMVTFELSNGTVAYYEVGWGKAVAAQNIKEFIGESGRIRIVMQNERTQDREEGDLIEYYNSLTGSYKYKNLKTKYKDTYSQIKKLIEMIEEKNEASPSMEEVLSSFKVCVAADKALRNDSIYRLNEKTQDIIRYRSRICVKNQVEVFT